MLLFWVEPRGEPAPDRLIVAGRDGLIPIDVGITPKAADPVALVGLPVWMWVENPSARTWGPNTISAGGVTMTARVQTVDWEMGDGTHLSCGKGTEWTCGDGDSRSRTCGHTYTKQGKYTVRATTHWVAAWSGFGDSGEFRFELTRSHRLDVGELQVIVTRGQ